jgi:predicted RNase H-like HicB family nuclease
MSAKSKSSPKSKGAIDRPFDPAILKRARAIAEQYQVILRREDGEWFGRGLELPNAHEDGATPEACVRKTRAMFVTVVAYLLEEGQTPPAPASDAVRDQQVNIRLTTEEKLRLEESSKQAGFRGVSDFMRAKSLA